MEINVEEIARQLGGARRSGNNWSCRCPAHEDKKASLSITLNLAGKVLVHCHAGCDPLDVISQLKGMNLWPSTGSRLEPAKPASPVKIELTPSSSRGRILATYDYVDENGELLYQAVRYEPKDFRQRAPQPDGSWIWSIKGIRRVLYRLPEVLEAVANGRTIYICEGEKDVEAARSLGLVATCNAMGADNGTGNKWLSEFASTFANADIVLVPDQDDAGMRHAEWVIFTLTGIAHSIKVANPTTGKDLADWIAAGATVADIEAAAIDAMAMQPEPKSEPLARQKFQFIDMVDLIANIKPIDWIVREYFESDSIALIYGPSNSGKSFFAVDIACSIAMNSPFFGCDVKQGSVFYIAGEGHNGLARRFKAWETDREINIERGTVFKSGGALSILDEEAVLEMVAVIEASGNVPRAVFIDTLARNFGSGDENSTEDMNKFIDHLDRHIRQRWNCLTVVVHHSGHNMDRARGSSALKAAVDAEYEVTKDESGNVRIRTTKMKDAEFPADMMLTIKSVELPNLYDDQGQPITSAVLHQAGNLANAVVATKDNGEKILAKDALAVLVKGMLSDRKLGTALDCSRRQAEKAMAALRTFKFIDDKAVTQEGIEALSRLGAELKPKAGATKFYHEGKE